MSDAGNPAADVPVPEMDDGAYAAYQDHRKTLIAGEQERGKSFDNYLLTLSGGALGLSLTFIGDMVTPGAIESAWLIIVSWLLLVGTVLAIMVTIYLSHEAHGKFCEILDEECAKGGRDFWKRVRVRQKQIWQPKAVRALNKISLATFAVGIGCMLAFTFVNLQARNVGESNGPRVETQTPASPE